MKKYYFLTILPVLSIILLATPAIAQTEGGDTTQNDPSTQPNQMMIRETLRAKTERELEAENIKNRLMNQRLPAPANASLENASGTRPSPSTTTMKLREENANRVQELAKERQERALEARKEMQINTFNIHKQNLVRQYGLAITNLENIKNRIISRIEKAEETSRDMTRVRNLLIIADEKIVIAKTAVNMLENYEPATTTATSTVDLLRPRQIGEDAINKIRDAKKSLNDVVIAIAQSMGLRLGDNATSTATTTP